MTEDEAPPAPLPPAAQPPYPVHPAPHSQPREQPALAEHLPEGAAIGALGITLIGSAVAAGLGLLIALPWLGRGKAKPQPKPSTPRARRKRTD